MTEQKKIKVAQCRVSKMREGGGTSMPWTWNECSICGAHEDSECRLSEEAINYEMTKLAWMAVTTHRPYEQLKEEALVLVKEILRQERVKAGTEPEPEINNSTFYHLLMIASGLVVGWIAGVAYTCWKYFCN